MEQLTIRAADAADIDGIIAVRRNKRDSIFYDAAATDLKAKAALSEELEKPKGEAVYLVETAEGVLMAACAYYFTFRRNGYTYLRVDFGCFKTDEQLEALRLVLDLSFETLNFNKIEVELRQCQREMLRLFLLAGFCAESCLKEHFYAAGAYEDVYRLGLTKTDFHTAAVAGHMVEIDFTALPVPSRDHLLLPEVAPGKNLLTGEKIDLVHFEQEDLEELYRQEKGSDQQFSASLGAVAPVSRKNIEMYVEHKNDYASLQEMLMFAIRKKDGALVGYINLAAPDLRSRNVTMGLVIMKPENRSSGYGGEAIRLITDFAFLELNMHRVYLGAFAFNKGAAGLYEHLGFRPEGRNRAFVYRNGRYYDGLAFGITRESWLAHRGYLKAAYS